MRRRSHAASWRPCPKPARRPGAPAVDSDILSQILFLPAPGIVPVGTHGGALHLRYGVNDLRLFFENDQRFLKQFA